MDYVTQDRTQFTDLPYLSFCCQTQTKIFPFHSGGSCFLSFQECRAWQYSSTVDHAEVIKICKEHPNKYCFCGLFFFSSWHFLLFFASVLTIYCISSWASKSQGLTRYFLMFLFSRLASEAKHNNPRLCEMKVQVMFLCPWGRSFLWKPATTYVMAVDANNSACLFVVLFRNNLWTWIFLTLRCMLTLIETIMSIVRMCPLIADCCACKCALRDGIVVSVSEIWLYFWLVQYPSCIRNRDSVRSGSCPEVKL